MMYATKEEYYTAIKATQNSIQRVIEHGESRSLNSSGGGATSITETRLAALRAHLVQLRRELGYLTGATSNKIGTVAAW